MMTANQLKVQQASHTRALPAWKHRRIAEENGWRALVRVLLSSFPRLGGGEGLRALLCEALLEDLLGALGLLVLLSLGDGAVLLLQDELDVARRRHVRVGATVGAVGPPALLLRAVHLDVEDLEVVGVEALNLSIALSVLEQVKQELAALLGPAALSGIRHLRLRVPADAAVEEAEGDGLLVLEHVLQVLLRLLQLHLLDRSRGDARILEVNTQV
mmetsp:Transcript_10400/g.22073  ORF Transcript_10400/g.22073 Transcript_10400/m.22073 type:complete len:215 (+) Transcript_10400:110-754(+)